MTVDPIILNLPDGFTEEQKKYFIDYYQRMAQKQTELSVVYNPDCGCKLDQMVLLDRFPMSPKIHSICPSCQKWCLMEISNPITFHLPLTNEDYSIEQMKTCVVPASRQEYVINKYKNFFNNTKEGS